MVSTRQRILGLAVLATLAASAAFLGCQSAPKEVRVGSILPLTGDAAVWGLSLKEGQDLALAEINAAGGVKGTPVKLLYEDDKATPADGVAALQKLIATEKVKAVVGVANSSVALAMMPIVNEKKIVFVSGGASSPKLTGSSPYFFRTWTSDVQEAFGMAQYAVKQKGYKKVALLYINNEYGIGLKDHLRRRRPNMAAR